MVQVLKEHQSRLARVPEDKLFQLARRLAGLNAHSNTEKHAEATESDRFVVCNGSRSGPSVAFVHPVGGHAFCYDPLVSRLSSRVRTCCVHHPEAAVGRPALPRSVEALGRLYKQAVERVVDDVPRVVVGWSFGGVVALEMAHQWEQEGKVFASILMIDSPLPCGPTVRRIERLLAANPRTNGDLAAEVTHLRTAEAYLQLARETSRLPVSDTGIEGQTLDNIVSVYAANHGALARYEFAPIRSPLTYMLATCSPESETATHTAVRLQRIAKGDQELIERQDDHFSIMTGANLDLIEKSVLDWLRHRPVSASKSVGCTPFEGEA